MAIAVDSISRVDAYTNFEPDWNHTVSGSDRLLVVIIETSRGSARKTVDSITYNGTSMTLLDIPQYTNILTEYFYLIAPDTGTHKVRATVTGVDSAYRFEAHAISFTGVHQTTPIGEYDSVGQAVSPNTKYDLTIDNLWKNSWVLGSCTAYIEQNANVESGSTSRFSLWHLDSNLDPRFNEASTYLNTTVGASRTISRTFLRTSPENVSQAILSAIELRSTTGYGGLTFDTNISLTSSINKQSNKVFNPIVKLSSLLSNITGTSVTFFTNLKLESSFIINLFLNITEGLKLTSSLSRIQTKILNTSVKLTSSISKLLVTLLNFTSSLSLSSTIRIIKDGIRVGIWGKVVKLTSDWTKQSKSTATWTKQDKEL